VFSLSTFIDSFKIGCHFYTQLRERAWFGSSVKSRLQYLGPCPGLPIPDDDLIKDAHLDPSAGPVDAFCLLVLDPEKVDYLNLKSNQRLMFTRNQKGDGTNSWMAEKISP
jgi:pyridoxamine 5'-phosphate oxidase